MDTGQKNKTKGLMVAFILTCLLVITALACVCYKLYSERNNDNIQQIPEEKYPASGNAIVVTEDSRDTVSAIQDKVTKGMISVKMTDGWIFSDGGASSNAYLANSERNSYDLRFEITLEDTGEVIMQSPDVPVGSCIENFPLSVVLEPGTYNVVVAHQQVEEGEVVNTVRTATVITVE